MVPISEAIETERTRALTAEAASRISEAVALGASVLAAAGVWVSRKRPLLGPALAAGGAYLAQVAIKVSNRHADHADQHFRTVAVLEAEARSPKNFGY